MSLQIVSDLHLESFKDNELEIMPNAPYLALLGDIGNVVDLEHQFKAFLTTQLRQFSVVVFVPGNHKAYESNWIKTVAILHDFEKGVRANETLGTFILLDRAVFRPPGRPNTAVVGCSLFSAMADESEFAVEQHLNDFHRTEDWHVSDHNAAHKRDLTWLNWQVRKLELEGIKNIVVLTHWSPSIDPRAVEARHRHSPVNSAFSTDLSGEHCFKSAAVKTWAFRRTHYNCDFTIDREGGAGSLRLVTNQRGYSYDLCEGFDGKKTVEIGEKHQWGLGV